MGSVAAALMASPAGDGDALNADSSPIEGRDGWLAAAAIGLGGLGVLVGVIVGVACALAVSPWLDQLTDRRNPSIDVSPRWIIVAGGIGLFAALVAACVPAWTAARLPVLTALSGRRPSSAPARRTLSLGIVMIGVAIVLTGTGAAMRL